MDLGEYLSQVEKKAPGDPTLFYGAYWTYKINQDFPALLAIFKKKSGEKVIRRIFRALTGFSSPTARRVWNTLTQMGLNLLCDGAEK